MKQCLHQVQYYNGEAWVNIGKPYFSENGSLEYYKHLRNKFPDWKFRFEPINTKDD